MNQKDSLPVKGYQAGAALSGREGVLFGRQLTEQERINLGMQIVAPYVGGAIGQTLAGQNVVNAFAQAGVNLVGDLHKGTQAWTQLALQAYDNVARFASYLNLPLPRTSTNKDAYVTLDIADELRRSFQSIKETSEDLFKAIREGVREAQKDYRLRVAYEKGEISIADLKQQLDNKEINLEDICQVAAATSKDRDALVNLIAAKASNEELITLIEKAQRRNYELAVKLDDKRMERAKKAIDELDNALHPTVADASMKVFSPNHQKAREELRELLQLGAKPDPRGGISFSRLTNTRQSTPTHYPDADKVVRTWWDELKDIARVTDIALSSTPGVYGKIGDGFIFT